MPGGRPRGGRATEVDVRPDLEEGREPFSRIIAAVEALADDGVLLLRAPFEPVPLYRVLGLRGFDHYTESTPDGGFEVWFHRARREGPPGGDAPGDTPIAFVVVADLRGLPSAERVARTFEALAGLPQGGALLQVHDRVPSLLLPMLAERGFECDVVEEGATRVRLLIRRRAS